MRIIFIIIAILFLLVGCAGDNIPHPPDTAPEVSVPAAESSLHHPSPEGVEGEIAVKWNPALSMTQEEQELFDAYIHGCAVEAPNRTIYRSPFSHSFDEEEITPFDPLYTYNFIFYSTMLDGKIDDYRDSEGYIPQDSLEGTLTGLLPVTRQQLREYAQEQYHPDRQAYSGGDGYGGLLCGGVVTGYSWNREVLTLECDWYFFEESGGNQMTRLVARSSTEIKTDDENRTFRYLSHTIEYKDD